MAKWLDKYEQGGMVLKQKTHDNYGKKPNPNDVQASVGPDFVGLGYNTKGRDYSPAWGGQFAMGGSIPGAVGFTYARTQDPAPSNGPYAKKTLASAQNGKKVDPNEKKYQAPDKNKIVDWFNNYYTSPFFKENLYDKGNAFMENVGDKLGKATAEKINNLNYTFKDVSSGGYYKGSSYDLENTVNMGNPNNYYNQSKSDVLSHELGHVNQDVILGQQPRNLAIMLNRNNQVNRKPLANEIYNIANEMPAKNTYGELQNPYLPSVGSYRADRLKNWVNDENLRSTGEFHDHVLGEVRGDIMALRYLASKEGIWDAAKNKPGSFTPEMLDKLYKSKNLNTPQVKKDSQGNITTNKPNPKSLKPNDLKNVAPPKKPGMILNRLREKYNDSDLLYLMNKLAKNEENAPMDKAQNGKEMSFYQNGLDWKPKTISKNGSVIKDDMGQWAHPGEVTEIGSNDITMQGVDYPVLGVSDTGDTQMMYPDQDYKFNGEKVTEFPMAQDGRNVPTTADSTRLYNSQIALNKFYENEMKAGRLKMSDIATIFDFNNYSGLNKDLNKANLNFYRGEIDRRSFKKEGIFDDEYKKMFNLSPEQVRQLEYKGLAQTKGSSEYQDYYRDIVTPMQNLASPFALIDKRIAPQRKISYSPVSLQDYPGGDVSVYDYDPILIKPVNALTPEERALRIKKYGKDSGIKETVSKPIQKPVSKPTPKPEPKSEPAPVVAQQPTPEKPTPQPKPLYEYEGEYVMAPTPGGGGGSMVGVKKKDGTIEYVKPEDYQRMGVPKYGQDYIKSKQKMQEGGWLSKYDNIPSGNNLKKQAEETIAKRNADRPTMSQYTPKKGEQVKFNKQKLQRIAEENAPLNRMAASKGAANMQDAALFALDAMTLGEGTLALKGLAKPVIKTLGKKLSSIPTSSRYITELENLGHVQTSGINKRAVQRIIDKEPSTSDVWLDTPTKEWNPEKFRIGVENEEGRTMINHPKGHTIKQNIKIENKGNYNEQTSRYYNISDNEGTGGITLDTKQHLGDPYVDINEINFFNRGKKLPSGKTSFNSSNEQMNIVFSHFPEKARIKPIDASIHSQPVMNARFAKLNSSQPGRIEIKPEYIDPLNKITHVQNPEPIDWYNETIEQFPKIKRTNQTLNEYTKAGLKEPFIRYKGKPISFEEFNTPQMKALFENPHTSSQAYDASDIMVNKYTTIKNWKNGGWLNKYK